MVVGRKTLHWKGRDHQRRSAFHPLLSLSPRFPRVPVFRGSGPWGGLAFTHARSAACPTRWVCPLDLKQTEVRDGIPEFRENGTCVGVRLSVGASRGGGRRPGPCNRERLQKTSYESSLSAHTCSIFPEFRNFISDFRQIEVTIHVFPRREDDSPILNPALGAKNDDLAYGQTHFQTSQPLSAPRVVFCGSFNLCTSSAS